MTEKRADVLWAPNAQLIEQSHMTGFARQFLATINRDSACDYSELHRLSLSHAGDFWSEVWRYCGLPGTPGAVAMIPGPRMVDTQWFPLAKLNYAEAALHPDKLLDAQFATSPAIIGFDEAGKSSRLTRQQLYEQVYSFAGFLRGCGIKAGDRVAAFLPNIPEAIVAMLATAAVGAIWSSCSPDFGDDAIVDRFGQIEPQILITSNRTTYNHKLVEPLAKVRRVLPRLPSVEHLVVVGEHTNIESSCSVLEWSEAIATAPYSDWSMYPFAHPLCIVYSSGTTGAPKCMVHGAGGTLLQHAKEHRLHCDLRDGDVLFYYTSTGWMMWNWLASALVSRATIVLYDGSPFANGVNTLLEIADTAGVTHFGAGARYYAALEKDGYQSNPKTTLARLRCLLSTGSPLLPSNFEWLYSAFGNSFTLASISGGTDILSCFVLGNPNAPVRCGHIQCKGLGMDVQVWNDAGERVIGQPGELVCASPFPSMPIHFWNDADQSKYMSAYFAKYPDVWCHGDWAEENELGEYIIYGRSDATLNPGGVRIGTAEIYQQLEEFPEIVDAIATVLRDDGDEQIVLFLRLADGQAGGFGLASSIRVQLKLRCSPRHVPRFIDYAPDLPRTISGKLSEIAVRSAINGATLGNAGALANPESLAFFEAWKSTSAY